MNNLNSNLLKGDFDRRKREANAAQYIALKQFERAEKRSQIITIAAMISWGAFAIILLKGAVQ